LASVPLRVLTWNLLHGRSVPPAGRDLFGEFADALAGWDWDVALLQETPPWWPPMLVARLGGDQRLALTSRNALLPVRRAIAIRHPDLIKSNGGVTLAASQKITSLDGAAAPPRMTVQKWPSMDALKAYRNSAAFKALNRDQYATFKGFALEGDQ